MPITVSQQHARVPVTILHVHGQVNLGNAHELEQAGRAALDHGARHVLLDLSQVSSLTSAGLRAVHTLYRLLGSPTSDPGGVPAKSPYLKVLNPSPDIRRVLSLAGFEAFIDIHDDLAQALASF